MRVAAALAFLLCLAGCWKSQPEGPEAAEGGSAALGPLSPSRLSTLTGLYQAGAEPLRSRLCVVAGRRSSRFGLVVWGAAGQSCSGSGFVSRDGGGLRFTMSGDSPCSIHASISGHTIIFDRTAPAGCGYYCGRGAGLAGMRLTQTGAARGAAMKAADLVGEPLCSDD